METNGPGGTVVFDDIPIGAELNRKLRLIGDAGSVGTTKLRPFGRYNQRRCQQD